jgi:hypothetical protein
MRYPTRESEFDHRRLQVPPSPLHDSLPTPPASMAARGRSIARSALDWGHQSALARCRCHGRRPHGPQLEEVPPPIASPVDSGRRHNRRPHPATASEESCRRRGHGLVSLNDPLPPPGVHRNSRDNADLGVGHCPLQISKARLIATGSDFRCHFVKFDLALIDHLPRIR